MVCLDEGKDRQAKGKGKVSYTYMLVWKIFNEGEGGRKALFSINSSNVN